MGQLPRLLLCALDALYPTLSPSSKEGAQDGTHSPSCVSVDMQLSEDAAAAVQGTLMPREVVDGAAGVAPLALALPALEGAGSTAALPWQMAEQVNWRKHATAFLLQLADSPPCCRGGSPDSDMALLLAVRALIATGEGSLALPVSFEEAP